MFLPTISLIIAEENYFLAELMAMYWHLFRLYRVYFEVVGGHGKKVITHKE